METSGHPKTELDGIRNATCVSPSSHLNRGCHSFLAPRTSMIAFMHSS